MGRTTRRLDDCAARVAQKDTKKSLPGGSGGASARKRKTEMLHGFGVSILHNWQIADQRADRE